MKPKRRDFYEAGFRRGHLNTVHGGKSCCRPITGCHPTRWRSTNKRTRTGIRRGLPANLERLLQLSYVVGSIATIATRICRSTIVSGHRPADVSQIEGGYSDSKNATKFDIVTAARTKEQRDAVLAYVMEILA
jgi:hypothetical protein